MDDKLFNELKESIREAGQIRRGERSPAREFTFEPVDIRRLRETVKASQSEFARMIGVSVNTLQNWEQGRRTPTGPAMALLRAFQKDPLGLRAALA